MSTKTIVLTSSDGESFEIEEAVARKSQTITHMLEDNDVNNGLHIPHVNGNILFKVIQYCKKHVVIIDDSSSKEELKIWDAEFTKTIDDDDSTLLQLIMAAMFLDIESLSDLICQRAADLIQDQTEDEIRTFFNIKNDYTAEEYEKVRQENQWAFE